MPRKGQKMSKAAIAKREATRKANRERSAQGAAVAKAKRKALDGVLGMLTPQPQAPAETDRPTHEENLEFAFHRGVEQGRKRAREELMLEVNAAKLRLVSAIGQTVEAQARMVESLTNVVHGWKVSS